jgi:hypothetical protein
MLAGIRRIGGNSKFRDPEIHWGYCIDLDIDGIPPGMPVSNQDKFDELSQFGFSRGNESPANGNSPISVHWMAYCLTSWCAATE